MDGKTAAESVRSNQKFFMNVVKQFKPEHADFYPADGMFTVAAQIRHVALTQRWFLDGAFGAGFDTNFEAADREARKPCGLAEAVKELDGAFAALIETLEKQSAADMMKPMADNPFFGASPRVIIVGAITDHTAHHRGSLSVYLRLLGVEPKMVYAE